MYNIRISFLITLHTSQSLLHKFVLWTFNHIPLVTKFNIGVQICICFCRSSESINRGSYKAACSSLPLACDVRSVAAIAPCSHNLWLNPYTCTPWPTIVTLNKRVVQMPLYLFTCKSSSVKMLILVLFL